MISFRNQARLARSCVIRERPAHCVAIVGALGCRQAGDQVALYFLDVFGAQSLEPRFRLLEARRAVARLGVRPLQHEDVIGGEIDRIEAQLVTGGGQPVHEVGAVQSTTGMKL